MGILVKNEGDALELEFVLPKPKDVKDKLKRSFWSSPEQFANHIKTLNQPQYKAWHKSAWTERNADFYGTKTLDEALDMSINGWKEGAEKIEKVLTKVKAQNPFRRKPVKYSIFGSIPDVARAVSGNPMNMKMPDLTKASRRQVVTIISDMGANCRVGSDPFINRAAVVTALIDELEGNGYACDVYVYGHTKGGDEWWGGGGSPGTVMTAIQLKNSNQPLDITRMAFGIGHTAMFRRLTFADWGGDDFCSFLGHGLGSTVHMDYDGLSEKNIFYLPTVDNNSFSTEQLAIDKGLEECITCMQKQGFKGFGPLPDKVEIVEKKKKRA